MRTQLPITGRGDRIFSDTGRRATGRHPRPLPLHNYPYLFIITLGYAPRRATERRDDQLGLAVTPRKSRRVGPTVKTDFYFAVDIALVSNLENQAQELLHRVESACSNVGLRLNAKKTEVMTFKTDHVELKTPDGSALALTEDFNYLGSYIGSTENDIRVRKALA